MSKNIDDLVDSTSTYCLNGATPWQNVTMGDDTLRLESDADAELLLHFGFRQTVKLSKITLGLPDDDTCPEDIKIFVNLNSPGFSDSDGKTDFSCTIEEGEGVKVLSLPAVKFSRVESVSIFITSNHGGDISTLHSVKMEGTPVMNVTDVSKIHDSK